MIIKSSEIINALKNTKAKSDSSRVLLNSLMKLRDDFVFSNGCHALSIQIDTDEDFLINGESEYLGRTHIKEGENYHQAVTKFVNSLSITTLKNKEKKLDQFIEKIKSQDCEIELEVGLDEDGDFQIASGNQSLCVKVLDRINGIDFGDLTIDLSK